jgi:uncharacterized membrane protein
MGDAIRGMWRWVRRYLPAPALWSEYDRVVEAHDRMVREGVEPRLAELNFRDGKMMMRMETAIAPALARMGLAALDETSAENYLEMQLVCDKTGERVAVTIQRLASGSKTPHQLRRLAEAERDALRLSVSAPQQENDQP